MLRLLLLETTSAFVERLAAALSSDDIAVCERMSLKAFDQFLSDGDVSAYDAIVLDLRQQHHDLRATCRRVFSRLKQHCPLIAVTSLDNVDAAIRLVEAGADEVCLRNECDVDFLMKRIRMAVARYDTQNTLLQTADTLGYSAPRTPALHPQLACDLHATDDDATLAKGPTVQVLCIDPRREVATHETMIRAAGFDLPVNIQDDSPDDDEASTSRQGSTAGIRTFQEHSPRYFVTKSAVAIPINPDYTPDETMCAEGFTIDISKSGVGFEVGRLSELPSELLLAGVEGDDGTFYFATVQVQHWKPQGGRLQVEAKFVTSDRELLRNENLMPSLHPDTYRFTTRLPTETLLKWAELGILRPVLVDRIYVCPKCESMPTFHKGCRSCGSIHIASHELILHTDCAHLGVITDFDQDGKLVCPKCGTSETNGHGGFERHRGPCRCLDCNWSDSDTEVVGQCLQCRWRFPLQNAGEHELIGFAVNRLDPRAFFGS